MFNRALSKNLRFAMIKIVEDVTIERRFDSDCCERRTFSNRLGGRTFGFVQSQDRPEGHVTIAPSTFSCEGIDINSFERSAFQSDLERLEIVSQDFDFYLRPNSSPSIRLGHGGIPICTYSAAANVVSGNSSQFRPSNFLPPAFGVRPPHCLKKNAVPPERH